MSKIERKVSKSSFGTKSAAAARASVTASQANKVVNRAAQLRAQKNSNGRAPK